MAPPRAAAAHSTFGPPPPQIPAWNTIALSEHAVGNRKIVNPLALGALDTDRNFVRAQKFAQKALLLLLFAHVLQRSVTHHGPRDRHFGAALWVFARELCDDETNTHG